MHHRLIPALSIAALSVSLAACSSGSAAPASNTEAVNLVAKAESAIQAQSTLHFVDKTTVGTQTQTVTGQFGPTASQEVLSVTGGSTIDVRLIDSTAYINTTSASTLEGVLGLTAAQAVPASGRWITLTKADLPYFQIIQALDIAQVVSIYLPSKSTAALGPESTIGGVRVIAVSGSVTTTSGPVSHSTLYLSTATSLPVKGTLTASQGSTHEAKTADFTSWGAPVDVALPAGSVPLATFKS